MKPTDIKTTEDYMKYLQSVIDKKDEVIETQMKQIASLLNKLAETNKKSE